MGKRIIQRRRGAGTGPYKSPGHRFISPAKMVPLAQFKKGGLLQVTDIVKDPAHSAPLLVLIDESFERYYQLAPRGIKVGDLLEFGEDAPSKVGNTLPMYKIPEGTPIYNIEKTPGDGGRFVRTSGGNAFVVSHDKERKVTIVRLPSKRKVDISFNCRASIGTLAGAGRTEKPMLKAGNMSKAKGARNKLYPRTSAVAMNAIDHPFGGSTGPGRASSTNRNAPPGQKVGNFAPSRTGVRRTRKKD